MVEVFPSSLDLLRVRIDLHFYILPVSFSKQMVSCSLPALLSLVQTALVKSLVHTCHCRMGLRSGQGEQILVDNVYVLILNDSVQSAKCVCVSLVHSCLLVLGDLHKDGHLFRKHSILVFPSFSDAFLVLNQRSRGFKLALESFYSCGLCCYFCSFDHFLVGLSLSMLFRDAGTHPCPDWPPCASILFGFDDDFFLFFDFYFRHFSLFWSFLSFKAAFCVFAF